MSTTSSVTTRFLVELLDQCGARVDDLLAAAKLDRAMLHTPDLHCPLQPFDALWQRAAEQSPDVGLTLFERFPPGQMHVVTHLALRSADVAQALEAVERYVRITQEDDRISILRVGGLVELRFENRQLDNGQRHNPWLVEHLLSMTHVVFARACGKPLPLHRVSIKAARQAPAAAYRARFGIDPQFQADANALLFDSSALAWPLQTQDAYLHGILEQFAAQRLPAVETELEAQVLQRLRASWLGGEEPQLDRLAGDLGLTAGQLRRRLAGNGCSFRQLKDDSRRDLARVHLAGPLANGEIAYLLGFSEPAALQHACKRWFGRSVGECRRDLR